MSKDMATAKTDSPYAEPSQMDRIKKKASDAPFVPIGIIGMVAALGYGAYSYNKRGKMSTSVFLMHLRVRAQGMVVGAITAGIAFSLFKDYIWKKEDHQKELELQDLRNKDARREKELQLHLAKHRNGNGKH